MGGKKTHEQYVQELTASNPLFASGAFLLESQYERATAKIACRCSRCGELFERRPDHLKHMGCPECDGTGKGPIMMTHDKFLKRLETKNDKYASGRFEIVGKYQGSLKPIVCRCPRHGEWSTTPSSLLRGTGCPQCANSMTNDEFTAKLSEHNEQYARGDIDVLSPYVDRQTRIKAICHICGKQWPASPGDLLGNHGCPNYRKHPGWKSSKTISEQEFLERLSEKQPDVELLSTYESMTMPLEVRCKICGHKWTTNGTKLITLGQGCSNWRNHPGYKSPKKKSHAEFLEDLLASNKHFANGEFELLSKYDGMDNYIVCRCLSCGNTWKRTAYDLISSGSDCPECSAKRRGLAARKSHDEFLQDLVTSNEFYATGKFEIVGQYTGSKEPIGCHCLVCDNRWDANPQSLTLRGSGCPRCSRSGTSRVEQILTIALEKALGEEAVLSRDKSAIESELDIYVPSHNLAIEYGSWFWHENRFQSDLDKMEKCRKKGIKLITIYDQCENPPISDDDNVKTYPFDLWSEKGQPALHRLVSEVLSRVGSSLAFSKAEWKSLREEASARTVLKSSEEFKEELAESNSFYAEGQFEIVGEYTGAQNKIDCRCNVCGYEWAPVAITLPNSKGCPHCANEIKKTHDEVVAEIAELNPDIEVIGDYKGASKKLLVRCRICGHEWNTTTGQIRQSKGCPRYRKHPGFVEPSARSQDEFCQAIQKANPNVEPLGKYKNANTKVLFHCKKCGYVWSTKPAVIINLGGGCPKCSGRAKLTHEEFLEKLSEKNGDYARGKFAVVGKYVNNKTKIECLCHQHGIWMPTPNALLSGTGCPECGIQKSHLPQYEESRRKSRHSHRRTQEQFLFELEEKNPHYASGDFSVVGTYEGSIVPIECSCPKHGNWSTTPSNLIHNASRCPECQNEARRFSHEEFISKLRERNRHYASGEFEVTGTYAGNRKKIECSCKQHGTWETQASLLLNGVGCPKCSSKLAGNSRRKTHEQFIEDLASANARYANHEFEVVGTYTDSRLPIECECPEHGVWEASYKALMYGSGCPRCVSLASMDPNLAAQWHPTLNGDLTPWDVRPGSQKNVWWQCGQGHEWQQRIDRRHYGGSKCPVCKKKQG